MTPGGGGLPGLIETMRVFRGTLPFLERHVARLSAACARVGLLTPSSTLLAEAEAHGLRPPADRIVRVSWDGASLVWDDRDLSAHGAMRVARVDEVHTGYPVKSTDRGFLDRAAAQARSASADEPLLVTSDGWVAETALYAVGWLDDRVIRFPELSLEILPSIGRARVMEIAGEFGLEVEEGRYEVSALAGRPAFVVNAVRGVLPVAVLDRQPVPQDERATALAAAFWPAA